MEKKLNLSAKIALCFVGLATVLMFIAVCCSAYPVAYKLLGASAISAAIGALVFTIARMSSKDGIRAKFVAGAIPMALVYFIVVMLYLVFFHECTALGTASGILMCIAGVYGIAAFVLSQINEAKQVKLKGEA